MLTNSTESRIVGLMDLGTHSVRLLLVRINPDHSYSTLSEQKEVVRLGEGEFQGHRLQPEAMRRAALVCAKFAAMARSAGAVEIVAVATAACREAKNKRVFLELVQLEAQIDLRVISGREEARLIHLGVASGLNIGDKQTLFIDIGGGSTEIIVGDQYQYQYLDTLKLGAIRLTGIFFDPDDTGPVASARYVKIQRHVRNTAVRTLQRLRQHRGELAIGSSGTIMNLAEIASNVFRNRPWTKDDFLIRKELRQIVEMLCSVPLKERRKIPGINPARADIIVSGAAIIDTFMDELEIDEMRVSERGLRDGLILDYLGRTMPERVVKQAPLRERSVLQLGRSCNFDELHARNVARLAAELFDSAKLAGLHNLGVWERELMDCAALLHDVGSFLSYNRHHVHSYYFILNADLLGFDQTEIAIVANTAFFHHKSLPGRKHSHLIEMDERIRKTIVILSIFVRLAESLDRSHSGVVQSARIRVLDKKSAMLLITATRDCQLEVWGVLNHVKAFKKAFDLNLIIEPLPNV